MDLHYVTSRPPNVSISFYWLMLFLDFDLLFGFFSNHVSFSSNVNSFLVCNLLHVSFLKQCGYPFAEGIFNMSPYLDFVVGDLFC